MRFSSRHSSDRAPHHARPHYLRNARVRWSATDTDRLRQLASANTPTRVIGFTLGRSAMAVQQKATSLGISLKPVNQSPYGRSR